VESAALEAVVSLCVAADLTLTMITFIASEEVAESDIIFYLSAVLLAVLCIDVLLRALKDGLKFFLRWLNWLEVFVCVGGAVMIVIDGVRRSCQGPECESSQSGKGASLGRAVRPLMRIFRVARAMSHMFFNRGGIHGRLDRALDQMTDNLVRKFLGDILLVPAENIDMKFSEGQFHVEKAQVRSEKFQGLHLPFTILGGLIDFLHLDIDVLKTAKRKNNTGHAGHRLLVILENVLLVVGPGHHQEPPNPPWDFEAVLQSKRKLIELVDSRMERAQFLMNSKSKKAPAPQVEESPEKEKKKIVARLGRSRPLAGKSSAWFADKITKAIDEVLAHGMHASIRNVEIRYEDPRGEISGGRMVVGGLEVGAVQLRAQGVGDDIGTDEEDFRVKGKWRRGTGEPCYDDSSFKDAQSMTASMTASKRTGTSSKKTKTSLRKGVRAAMHVNRVAAFLDLQEAAGVPGAVQPRSYAEKLQEGMNVDVVGFLQGIRKLRARERLRMAICTEVERRLLRCEGKIQKKRVQRLSEVEEPEKYKERLSTRLLQHLEKARLNGDKDKLARLLKFEDRGCRETYAELAVSERSVYRLTVAESRAAVERMRRLRDKVASHRYLLMPSGCSVHAIVRAPAAAAASPKSEGSMSSRSRKIDGAMSPSVTVTVEPMSPGLSPIDYKASTFWPPQTDIDVQIPSVPLTVDLSQARAISSLIDYFKRWKTEDHRMMWYPPPHHSGYYSAFARWGYALRMVLHGIDEKYPWHSLAWVEMRRQSRMKFEYVDALCTPDCIPAEDDLVATLQVSMPLTECVAGRYAAAKFRSHEKERTRRKQQQAAPQTSSGKMIKAMKSFRSSSRVGESMSWKVAGSATTLASEDGTYTSETSEIREMKRKQAVRNYYNESLNTMKELEEEAVEEVRASAKAFQVQFYFGLMQAKLLEPATVNKKSRRVFVTLEASGIQVVSTHSAPQLIWMKLAPPKSAAKAVQEGKTPEGAAAEVGVEDIRAIFSGMPSSASRMRRLFGGPRLTNRVVTGEALRKLASSYDMGNDLSKDASMATFKTLSVKSSAQDGLTYQAMMPNSLSETDRLNADFVMQVRVAYMGKEEAEDTETFNGTVSAVKKFIPHWDFAVWTFPLEANVCIPMMKKIVLNFKPPPHVPRWATLSHESYRFWEELQILRKIHVEAHVKRKKKARQAELLTGVAGPLVGSRVSGEVLLRGGFRGAKLDIYCTICKGLWIRHCGAIPTGTIQVERVVDGGPQFKLGFCPASSSTSNVQFQSADGWWFAEESEALNATRVFTTGQPSPQTPKKGDDSWGGSVAHENPLETQDPIYALPRNALSSWGVSNPRDGSIRSRYKPPISAKGLLQLPNPDKRRSGSSLGTALDCCRSLEKTLPDPVKPALYLVAATIPEDGISTCCSKAPQDSSAIAPSQRTNSTIMREMTNGSTMPLMATDMSNGHPAPSFTSASLTERPPAWASAPVMAERKISAQEPWTLSDMDCTIEVIQGMVLGLPDPTPESLKEWWRKTGLVVE